MVLKKKKSKHKQKNCEQVLELYSLIPAKMEKRFIKRCCRVQRDEFEMSLKREARENEQEDKILHITIRINITQK